MLIVKEYSRKPLTVEAVQITDDNIKEVAEWCGGDVCSFTSNGVTTWSIEVKVLHAKKTPAQQAHVGDWILKSKQGVKIYQDMPFRKGFVVSTNPTEVSPEAMQTLKDTYSS